jgi:hypothetical protein
MSGGGESAEAAFRTVRPYLVGHDVFQLEAPAPGRYPLVPNDRWADPGTELRPI